jgi:cytochrome c556
VVGGHALPNVWENWTDFSKRMEDLTANIAALAKTSESGSITAVAPTLQAALDCKSCHEVYSRPLTAKAPSATVVNNEGIDYREHIMKTLNEQSEALGMILSTAIPDDNASAHLEIIALTASTALKAFEPKIPGGESKSAVWTNWPDFSKRMQEFTAKTADAAKLAKEKGSKAGLTDIDKTLTCKSCHDTYREEKKK